MTTDSRRTLRALAADPALAVAPDVALGYPSESRSLC